jgi:hypothetical protein
VSNEDDLAFDGLSCFDDTIDIGVHRDLTDRFLRLAVTGEVDGVGVMSLLGKGFDEFLELPGTAPGTVD